MGELERLLVAGAAGGREADRGSPVTPEFAAALRRVVPWAKANGWERDVFPQQVRCRDYRLIWDEYGWIAVSGHNRFGFTQDLGRVHVESAQQAVDVLCALGVLPTWFSSMRESA